MKKAVFGISEQVKSKTGLLNYMDKLEAWNLGYHSKKLNTF